MKNFSRKTKRLILIPCDLSMLQALLEGNFEDKFSMPVADEWPSSDVKEALPVFIEFLSTNKTEIGWGLWLIVEKSSNIVVGGVGFIGKPDKEGFVEIGYSIAPSFQRLGYASEASRDLILWALMFEDVVGIEARCKIENEASCVLLKRLSFVENSRIGDEINWVLVPA